MYNIIQKRKIWFSASAVLVLLSILSLAVWGLNLGIDFTGGSMLELKFTENRPDNTALTTALNGAGLTSVTVQPVDELGVIIRTGALSEEKHQEVLLKLEQIQRPAATAAEGYIIDPSALGLSGEGLAGATITSTGEGLENIPDSLKKSITYQTFEELRFESIGPVIGQELQEKSIYAVIIVLLAIIAYIAYAFRKVSYPVASWKYGLSAIIALIHDVLIVTGVFSILGHFWGIQVDAYFITAILTILGFSVHDTIVTFDRTRENLHRRQDQTFENMVNISVNETLVRSLNTSLTTAFVLLAVLLFGGESVRYFVLALFIGIFIGTYSSIYIASPLLVEIYRRQK